MKKSIFYLLTIAAMAFSCQRISNVDAPEDSQDANVKMITVTCTLPDADPDSKVTLVNDGLKGKTEWVAGDEVFFHGKKVGTGYSCVAAAHDVSADGKTAKFTIPDLSEKYDGGTSYNSSLFAIYPASAVADYTEGKSWYYISAFKNTNNLLLAACNDFTADEYSFTFFNLVGALSFKVDGSSFGGFDKYVFEGNGGETIGWTQHSVAFATLKSDSSVEERYRYKGSSGPGASSGALTTIAVTPASGWDNGSTINTIYFPGTGEYDKAAANFTSGFTIKFYKGEDEVKRVSTKTAKNITVGKLLDLGDITSHLFTYVPPAKHDSSIGCPADNSDYDLSKTASANCYIVDKTDANQNKVFKFKAYKGKGTTNVGTISSVQILWETYNNSTSVTENSVIAAVDYDKQTSNDYYEICFKTPETMKAGNALIAAKDGLGNVLWSWHIWIPSTPITSSTYGGVSNSPMMSRNLGALVDAIGDAETDIAIESCGMYYQWGRKDPFPGAGEFANYPGSMVAVSNALSTRGATSEADIHKYPTAFVVTGADTDGYKDWSVEHSATLWGSTKTQNDPCPPGWKLPIFASSTGDLWDSGVSDKTTLPGWSNNVDHHWFRFGVDYDALNPTTTGYVYFPYAGYRTQDNGGYSYCNKRAHIWQAKGGDSEYARLIYAAPNAQYVDVQRKGRGGNVRCVVDE